MIVVLMGVTGSGKTTIGERLAARMDAAFADADDYHSEANKAKMASGQPLNDADRAPWLATLNAKLREWQAAAESGVLACSALKEAYREALRAGMPAGAVRFVLLDGAREMIAERLAARRHEYMNPGLLESQIATLERPGDALVICNDRAPEVVVEEILGKLG